MYFYLIPFIVFALDLATKALALAFLIPHHFVEILPFFNLYLTFNKGVSFSMFRASDETGVWLLTALTGLISLAIIYFMQKEKEKLVRIGLALMLGGALGNIWDRIRLGMVVDFLDFHLGTLHWPAFNIADSAICIGVTLILWQAFFQKKGAKNEK